MNKPSPAWKLSTIAPLLGALACSGTTLHEIGDLDSGGHAGMSAGDIPVAGSTDLGDTGDDSGAGRSSASAGAAGVGAGGSGLSGGGQAGGSVIDPEAGAAGSGVVDAPLICPACTTIADGQDVRSIAVDDTRVLWADYGTKDVFGNYNENGRLLTRDLDSGTTNVLADSVLGPEWVGLSPKYAYAVVDRGYFGASTFGVVRVPLVGGVVESLEAFATDTYSSTPFANGGGYEYWPSDGLIYRIADEDGASAEVFAMAANVYSLLSDDTHLYYEDGAGRWSLPFTGGAATLLDPANGGSRPYSSLLLSGDYIYAIETPAHADSTPTYLSRLPKAGGSWKRVVQYGQNTYFSQLAIDGDKYFFDQPTYAEDVRQLLQGSLSTPGDLQLLASQAHTSSSWWGWKAWSWSRIGIFISASDGLYLTPTR